MEHVYKAISKKLLSEKSDLFSLFEVRIKYLYGYALGTGYEKYPLEFSELCDEIIWLEREIILESIAHIEDFEKIKPDDIIQYYSFISTELAKQHFNDKKPSLLASLLGEALEKLLNVENLISEEAKEAYEGETSDIFMDFKFANGSSEYTSLKMAPIIMPIKEDQAEQEEPEKKEKKE